MVVFRQPWALVLGQKVPPNSCCSNCTWLKPTCAKHSRKHSRLRKGSSWFMVLHGEVVCRRFVHSLGHYKLKNQFAQAHQASFLPFPGFCLVLMEKSKDDFDHDWPSQDVRHVKTLMFWANCIAMPADVCDNFPIQGKTIYGRSPKMGDVYLCQKQERNQCNPTHWDIRVRAQTNSELAQAATQKSKLVDHMTLILPGSYGG